MGYTTYFNGEITVEPPLSEKEVSYLNKFASTRRMNRKKGAYYVDGGGSFGQAAEDDVIDNNYPDPSQPGLWCQWIPNDDGTAILWDDGEKFYEAGAWMEYIIEHFIGKNPKAQEELPFFTGHKCSGVIYADGEESDDNWMIEVKNGKVNIKQGEIVYK